MQSKGNFELLELIELPQHDLLAHLSLQSFARIIR